IRQSRSGIWTHLDDSASEWWSLLGTAFPPTWQPRFGGAFSQTCLGGSLRNFSAPVGTSHFVPSCWGTAAASQEQARPRRVAPESPGRSRRPEALRLPRRLLRRARTPIFSRFVIGLLASTRRRASRIQGRPHEGLVGWCFPHFNGCSPPPLQTHTATHGASCGRCPRTFRVKSWVPTIRYTRELTEMFSFWCAFVGVTAR